MARIQILELPTIYRQNGDDETPFVVIIDDVSDPMDYVAMADFPERLGARAILIFEEAMEIPANEVAVGLDGYPVRPHVEGDFSAPREQATAEMARAQSKVDGGHRFGGRGFDDPVRCSVCMLDQITWLNGDVRTCEVVQIDKAAGHDFRRVGLDGQLRCYLCGTDRIGWAASREARRCEAIQSVKGAG